ncbi:hypothetical protein RTCIAT899_CH12040 [Rhizobium tropici CIAT 899]|nr:hypothetical protein RTCIAT899_CH12040 [Rhizobium tropici CIAT 899]
MAKERNSKCIQAMLDGCCFMALGLIGSRTLISAMGAQIGEWRAGDQSAP